MAGVQIKNGNRIVVINSGYKNFACRYSGSTASGTQQVGGTSNNPGQTTGSPFYQCVISIPYDPSNIFAFRAAGQRAFLLYVQIVGSTANYHILVTAPNFPVEWRIFTDLNLCAISGPVGFRVFRTDHSLAFDSRLRYMRVMSHYSTNGVFTPGFPSANTTLQAFNFPGRAMFAVMNCNANQVQSQVVGTGPKPPVLYIWMAGYVQWSDGSNGVISYDMFNNVTDTSGSTITPIVKNITSLDVMMLDCTGF